MSFACSTKRTSRFVSSPPNVSRYMSGLRLHKRRLLLIKCVMKSLDVSFPTNFIIAILPSPLFRHSDVCRLANLLRPNICRADGTEQCSCFSMFFLYQTRLFESDTANGARVLLLRNKKTAFLQYSSRAAIHKDEKPRHCLQFWARLHAVSSTVRPLLLLLVFCFQRTLLVSI